MIMNIRILLNVILNQLDSYKYCPHMDFQMANNCTSAAVNTQIKVITI